MHMHEDKAPPGSLASLAKPTVGFQLTEFINGSRLHFWLHPKLQDSMKDGSDISIGATEKGVKND